MYGARYAAMKLADALKTLAATRTRGQVTHVALVCGFEPLHLQTFLKAEFADRFAERRLELSSGVYADLEGNLERARAGDASAVMLVLEWADLDPRLGMRSASPWSGAQRAQIHLDVTQRLQRLAKLVACSAGRQPLALVAPTLPWMLAGPTAGCQHGAFELALQHALSEFLVRVAALPGVRVLHPNRLARLSPEAQRHDPRSELAVGFPYQLPHASAVAALCVELLFPPPPKKGLITDLDGTLWAGLVGELDASPIGWSQADASQIHGLYQLTLRQLADAGVLLAVASKNDPEVVRSALQRSDLWIAGSSFFPVCASWEPKSRAVASILQAWNISAQDVVVVDDSPMELDEVRRLHPGIECLLFEPHLPDRALRCCERLRDLFGQPTLTTEDGMRAASIRSAATFEADKHAHDDHASFVRGLQGVVRLRRDNEADSARALQLLNKTNQFNLNGRRVSAHELAALRDSPSAFVTAVEYSDRYGALGIVGVLAGRIDEDRLLLLHWVLSCRAFSRHVEHHMLYALSQLAPTLPLELAYEPTTRNGPLRTFLQSLHLSLDGPAPPLLAPGRADALLQGLLPHTPRAADG